MSEKVYNLVSNVVDGVEIIAVAVVSYCTPDATVAASINASILVIGTAITTICKKFVKA